MMGGLSDKAFDAILSPWLESRIRRGSLRAVKFYVHVVGLFRLGAMGLTGLGGLSAVLVAGVVLVVIGGVGLIPMDPRTLALIVLIIGAVLFAAAGLTMMYLFNEKRWLQVSRATDLVEAVTSPWDGLLPANLMKAIREAQNAEEEFLTGQGKKAAHAEITTPEIPEDALLTQQMIR